MLKKLLIGALSTLVVTAVGASAYNTTLKPALEQAEPQIAAAVVEAGPAVSVQAAQAGADTEFRAGQAASGGSSQSAGVYQNQAQAFQAQQVRGGGNGPGSPSANGQPMAAASNNSMAAMAANPGQAGNSGQGRGNRNGGGGQGRQNQTGSADGSAVPSPQNGLVEWISLEGTVSQIAYPTFLLTSADGQTTPVSVGNLNYATSLGIDLSDGEAVSLVGYWDTDGSFAIGSLVADGQTYSLRDDYGRPLWSGGSSH